MYVLTGKWTTKYKEQGAKSKEAKRLCLRRTLASPLVGQHDYRKQVDVLPAQAVVVGTGANVHVQSALSCYLKAFKGMLANSTTRGIPYCGYTGNNL
jgi:hypothetical protein